MEINGDVETNEIDQATLLKMATNDNKEADRKELYLEHLRMITAQAIESQEKEFSQLSSDIKV